MYLVYLFKEKSTGQIIYVGSSARPAERMKEHARAINGDKKSDLAIYRYIRDENLRLYKDIEVIWVDSAKDKEEMYELEEQYYFKYLDTIKNERPAEIRKGVYNPRRRKVKCLNDGKIFATVTDCAKYYGKGRTTISNVLINEKEHTWINGQKYRFEYIN